MKRIIRSLIAWWQSKRGDRSNQLPPIRMPVPAYPSGGPVRSVTYLVGERGPDIFASRALLHAAVSVPRRLPASRVVPGSTASRWRALEEGMSMLPAAMLLASYYDDGATADAGSFG